MPTVADASPLIFYARINRLLLLQQLFNEILVPPTVWDEIMASHGSRAGAEDIASAHWIRQHPLVQPTDLHHTHRQIDLGEAEAIALALQLGTESVLVTDDAPARRFAIARGLTVIGSAGIALLATDRGLLTRVTPVLEELRSVGLYLSDDLFEAIIASAGE